MRTVGKALLILVVLFVILTVVAARAMPDGRAAAGDAAALAVHITCPPDTTVNTEIGVCSASVSFAATATPGLGCRLLGIA